MASLETAIGIAILARVPVPGQAKTRLIPTLGAAGAARLQRWMLQRTLATACAADVGPVSLCYAGEPSMEQLALWRAGGVLNIRPQASGDLGARMLVALRQSATPTGALVIGSDCPALCASHLRQAAAALGDHEAVAIPAEDGGYVLIGMRRPAPEVFAGIAWGGAEVMASTRQRLAALGWRWHEPATLWDVDRAADVERLAVLCPEIREILRDDRQLSATAPTADRHRSEAVKNG